MIPAPDNSDDKLSLNPSLSLDLDPRVSTTALRLLSKVGLDLLFVLLIASFLVIILWQYDAPLKIAQQSVLYPIGIMAALILTRSAIWGYHHSRNRVHTPALPVVFLQTGRDWLPFILISFIYENLHDLTDYFSHHDIAVQLMALDIRLFGVEPVLWSQRFFHPLLTDYMAFAYALYFILPLFTMYLLACRNRRTQLQEMILALSMTFIMGFVGYVFFPCSPPRYHIDPSLFVPQELHGIYIYEYLQGKWDSLSAVRLGAFPSLHVGISSVALIYVYRFRKWSRFDGGLFGVYLVLIVSLWIATIYLRHHWFVDIAAGWFIAFFAAHLAPVLMKQWALLHQRTSGRGNG